jgi:autotransporter translocation and assembly factor TamB
MKIYTKLLLTIVSIFAMLWLACCTDTGFKYLVKIGGRYWGLVTAEITGNLQQATFTKVHLRLDKKYDLFLKTCSLSLNIPALITGKLQAEITMQADALQEMLLWLPALSRVKGLLQASVQLTGNIFKPHLQLKLQLDNGTMRIPSLGIKLKPVTASIISTTPLPNSLQDFKIQVHAHVRDAPGLITITGNLHEAKILIKNAVLVNNHYAMLKMDAQLLWQPTTRSIRGELIINEGNINFSQHQLAVWPKTDDLQYSDTGTSGHSPPFDTIDCHLRIAKGVSFTGFNLQTTISGKLHIYNKQEYLLGEGRITLKEGSYQLPACKFRIYHGRLLYPPGTLLSNPRLEIRLAERDKVQVYVDGSLENPVLHNIGLDNTQALGYLVNSSGGEVLQELRSKLAIEPLVVEQDPLIGPMYEQGDSLENKYLVVEKKLTKKLNLQYLKGLLDKKNAVRLKYHLNKYWDLGLETGINGSGADLNFSIDGN